MELMFIAVLHLTIYTVDGGILQTTRGVHKHSFVFYTDKVDIESEAPIGDMSSPFDFDILEWINSGSKHNKTTPVTDDVVKNVTVSNLKGGGQNGDQGKGTSVTTVAAHTTKSASDEKSKKGSTVSTKEGDTKSKKRGETDDEDSSSNEKPPKNENVNKPQNGNGTIPHHGNEKKLQNGKDKRYKNENGTAVGIKVDRYEFNCPEGYIDAHLLFELAMKQNRENDSKNAGSNTTVSKSNKSETILDDGGLDSAMEDLDIALMPRQSSERYK